MQFVVSVLFRKKKEKKRGSMSKCLEKQRSQAVLKIQKSIENTYIIFRNPLVPRRNNIMKPLTRSMRRNLIKMKKKSKRIRSESDITITVKPRRGASAQIGLKRTNEPCHPFHVRLKAISFHFISYSALRIIILLRVCSQERVRASFYTKIEEVLLPKHQDKKGNKV